MPLAEQFDVEASLLRALTEAEEVYVTKLIARQTRAVQVYTGQTIEEVEDDEVTLWPDIYGNLRLPQWPVTAVSSVVVDGETLDADDYEWTRQGIITRPLGDGFERDGVRWSGPVTVIYTHGYATNPADIAQIIGDNIAARLGNGSSGGAAVKAAEVDDVRVEYDTTQGGGTGDLDDDQRATLDRYKLPAAPIDTLSSRRVIR